MMNARQGKSIRGLQPGLSFSIEGAEKEALDILPDFQFSLNLHAILKLGRSQKLLYPPNVFSSAVWGR